MVNSATCFAFAPSHPCKTYISAPPGGETEAEGTKKNRVKYIFTSTLQFYSIYSITGSFKEKNSLHLIAWRSAVQKQEFLPEKNQLAWTPTEGTVSSGCDRPTMRNECGCTHVWIRQPVLNKDNLLFSGFSAD